MWRVRRRRRRPKAGYICSDFFMFSVEKDNWAWKSLFWEKPNVVNRGGWGAWPGRVRYMGESPARVTDIETVVAAEAIKSVKSGIASKIQCMYVRGQEGGLQSRQCCNCCCSCCSNQISQVRHLWRRPRAKGGGGRKGGSKGESGGVGGIALPNNNG